MKRWMAACIGLFLSHHCVLAEGVLATKDGLSIDTGAGGIYVLSYPHLLNPKDQGNPVATVDVKPEGTGVAVTYQPGGKLDLEKQPDGSWLFHFTEIPSDRMKFSFNVLLPLELATAGATWSVDGAPPKPFPADKGTLNVYQGDPKTLAVIKSGVGFTLTYPQKTWTQLMDVRNWGMKNFKLGQIYYFPDRKTAPEISYSLKIDVTTAGTPPAAATPTPASTPAPATVTTPVTGASP